MTTSTTIPTKATDAELDAWLRGEPDRKWQREQMGFAAMGYLGMARHAYLSADWVAHNELWASACNRLSEIIDPRARGGKEKSLTDRIGATYRARGIKCNAE